jgi:crotonobetainyl-CoA:carnitine CoA-transferase CaiB-like acyl-CoA transferase
VANLQAADVLAGTHAFGAIAAALLRRGRTGQGAYVDVSMLEALVAAEDVTFGSILNEGEESRGPRIGMVVHAIRGRSVAMQTVGSPELWPRVLALMERPDLATDPRFATPTGRRENWAELNGIFCRWLEHFESVEAALAALTAARIPCAPVLSPAEVVAHPHLAARGGFPEVSHPTRGTARITRTPFHLDGAPIEPAGPAPFRAGEHTREVLTEVLGYAKERIEELRSLRAIDLPD